MSSYNLLDEPWIPVMDRRGKLDTIGILGLVARGEEWGALATPLATQAVAVRRLIAAMLMRATGGPPTTEQWRRYWDHPESLAADFSAYAERVRSRFDLFDDAAPFYQVADLRTAKGEVAALNKVVAEVPAGEPFFTTRSARNLSRISAAEAALWILHAMFVDPSGIKSGAVGDTTVKGGKGYPIGVAWGGMIGSLMVSGNSVHEMLMLNLVPHDVETVLTVDYEADLPAWERPPLTARRHDRLPDGPADLLTWQSRRLRLVGDPDGVTGVLVANGDALRPQDYLYQYEPYSAWRFSKPQTQKYKRVVFMPSEHDPERQAWRGITQLLPRGDAPAGDDPQPPVAPIVQWLARLTTRSVVPGVHAYRLESVGVVYGSNSSTYEDIFADETALPAALYREPNIHLRRAVADMVLASDEAVGALANLARNLAKAAGADRDALPAQAERARVAGYAQLDHPMRAWILSLSDATDPGQAKDAWRETCRRVLSRLGDDLMLSAGNAAWRGDRGDGSREVDGFRADLRFRVRLNDLLGRGESPPVATTASAS